MEGKEPGEHANAAPADNSGRTVRAQMRGRVREILFSFALMTLPMLLFSALLLGLIFHYKVSQNAFVSPNLQFATLADDKKAILVGLSATTLTTIASWSSTLAPILVGSAVTLISFPVARKVLQAGEKNEAKELPTPWQLALMLRMMANGSPSSLWQWVKYAFRWRGKKELQGKPIRTLTAILTFGIVLSVLVFITDTWLHFTTKTITFIQINPVDNSALNHSFALIPNCTNQLTTSGGIEGGCTLNPAAATTFLIDGFSALKVLANTSDVQTIRTFTSGSSNYAYVGNPSATLEAPIDFTAKTFAVQSSCTPVTSKCFDKDAAAGIGFPFKCPFAFEGYIPTDVTNGKINQIFMAYFTDSSAQNNETSTVSIDNPYYFAAAFSVNQNIGWNATILNDPDVEIGGHGSTIFAVFCNATVLDVEYTSVNGSITRWIPNPSNSSTANILQGTQQYTHVGDDNLISAACNAAMAGSSQHMADAFANSYSAAALGAAAGAFVAKKAVEAQSRTDILVARVPVAPLVCLLFSNLALVVLGIVLAALAFIALRSDEVGEVQSRLSIPALVAAQFEGTRAREGVENVDEMFEESRGIVGPRVGFVRTAEGGWTFGSWQPA